MMPRADRLSYGGTHMISTLKKPSSRLIEVDMLRGLAILGVVIFHIVWDLEFTGFISGIAFHPLWLGFGRVLAGSFVFLVGVSLVLAHWQGFVPNSFLRRLLIVSSAAAFISIATRFVFPDAFIFFGILHAIAVSSVVGLVFLRLPQLVLWLAIAIAYLMPKAFNSPALDTRWLAWTGLFSNAPPSNDFVPLFPWIALTLIGISLARSLKLWERKTIIPDAMQINQIVRFIVWCGKKSLPIYLVHQPVLLAIILSASWLLRG